MMFGFVNDTVEAMIPTSKEAKIQFRGGNAIVVVLGGWLRCRISRENNPKRELDQIFHSVDGKLR